jgi:hypothetical protein
MSDEKIQLERAVKWTCPGCGKVNYCDSWAVEATPEDIDYMIEHYGGEREDYATGEMVCDPEEVTCEACKREYEVLERHGPGVPPHDEEE